MDLGSYLYRNIFFIIKVQLDLFFTLSADNQNVFSIGPLGKSPGSGEGLKDRHIWCQWIGPGRIHLSYDINFSAAALINDHGDFRCRDKVFEFLSYDLLKFCHCFSLGHYIPYQWKSDSTVRRYCYIPGEFWFPTHVNIQYVVGTN